MEEKGTRSLIEVYRSVPGVQVGNNPGEPGATVVRGFSKAVGYSIDGSRAADPHLVSRDYDAFNFERVEMLKGPASVVYGTNGLAGSINIVTKQATLDRNFVEGLVGYGSFNTARLGLGANIVLSPYAAMRSTVSLARSNSYIDDTDWEKISFTNNFLVKPSDRLKFTASVDYYKDDFNTGYWGTPLVPRSIAKNPTDIVSNTAGLVIDKSLRSTNYNYGDGTTGAETYWLRGAAEYKLSSEWTLKNELNYYNADRRWKDAEFFDYAGDSSSAVPTSSATTISSGRTALPWATTDRSAAYETASSPVRNIWKRASTRPATSATRAMSTCSIRSGPRSRPIQPPISTAAAPSIRPSIRPVRCSLRTPST